jgi:CelD/BcsL family acetyltransferase involved in cellulose biosynthesis
MAVLTLRSISDVSALEASWRELETRSEPSFFQSWTWLGCLAERRFTDPVLLQVSDGGTVVGLGLFNRRRSWRETLWLGETGYPESDAVFTEHNGPLLAIGYEHLARNCVAAALADACAPYRRWPLRRVVLSGASETLEQAALAVGRVSRVQTRAAPVLNIRTLGKTDYLSSLGRTTRYQLRRSLREIAHRGPVTMRRATSRDEALGFLAELARLHQRSWTDRGKPGSFSNAAFVSFHRALVERGWPRQEIDLWRLSAGDDHLAYLYNFRHRSRVASYQSGVDYRGARPQERPGLTAHHLAIEHSIRENDSHYDFLAGPDRYKVNLSNETRCLHWLSVSASYRRRPT